MNMLPNKEIPEEILNDSVLAHIAAAYFAVGKRLERKTQCSATRGFILSTLRDGTTLNQNQVATLGVVKLTQEIHRRVIDDGALTPVFDLAKKLADRRTFAGAGVSHEQDMAGLQSSRDIEAGCR